MFKASIILKELASGNRYVVRWRPQGAHGPRPAVPFALLTHAELYARLVEQAQGYPDPAALRATGLGYLVDDPDLPPAPPAPAGAGLSLVEACTEYVATLDGIDPTTKQDYQRMIRMHVAPHFGARALVDCHEVQLREWQRWMKSRKLSDKSIKNVRGSVLSPVFRRAMWRGPNGEPPLMDYNPLAQVGAPGPGRGRSTRKAARARARAILTGPQARTWMRAASTADADVAETLLVCAGTGLRWQEVTALYVDAYDRERGELDVFRVLRRMPTERAGGPAYQVVEDTKSEAGERGVPVAPVLLGILNRRADEATAAGRALLFPNPRTGKQWHKTRWHARINLINAAAAEAGVPVRLTAHSLRHLFHSLMTAGGLDRLTLAEIMGHTSASTGDKFYGHALGHDKARELADRAVADLIGARIKRPRQRLRGRRIAV